ncbi:MAG: SRPBCC domain-containing protein [Chloroflexi bacterium]|nr:SRPBCC domain-containing protein [Chloroflexota bacterium]
MTLTLIHTDSTEVIYEASFEATPPASLFTCWTDAEKLMQWWPQQVRQLDVRDGGRYEFSWPTLDNATLRGEFRDVVEGQGLKFTWKWDHLTEMPGRTVTITFSPYGVNGTLLRVRHGTYDDSARDQEDRQHHIDGWGYFLARLVEICRA